MKEKKYCIVGIVIGIIIIIFGVSVANMYIGEDYVNTAIFGADYYTRSYRAMAATANNIIDLIYVVQKGLSYVLYAIGLFDICYFVLKLTENSKIYNSNKKATVATEISTNTEAKEVPFEQNTDNEKEKEA